MKRGGGTGIGLAIGNAFSNCSAQADQSPRQQPDMPGLPKKWQSAVIWVSTAYGAPIASVAWDAFHAMNAGYLVTDWQQQDFGG